MDIDKNIDKMIEALSPKTDDILSRLKILLQELQKKNQTTWMRK